MARITFTKSGCGTEGKGDMHISGYDFPLPVGIYHHEQYLDRVGPDLFFCMNISQWGGSGYDEEPLKLGFSERMNCDFKIANNVRVDANMDIEVEVQYWPGTIRTRR